MEAPVRTTGTAVPDPVNNPADDAEASSGGQVDPSDIDALVAASGQGATDAGAADATGLDQADIDALMSASGEQGAKADGKVDGEFSQSDIDALFSGGDAGPSAAGKADGAAAEPRVDAYGNPFDAAAAAMADAIAEENAAAAAARSSAAPGRPGAPSARAFDMPEFATGRRPAGDGKLDMLMDVKLRVKIELGRTHMLVEDVLKLGEGSVVELDKLAGDPVDVYVNDRLIARGEVLVLNENFCVRVSEVLDRDPHRIGSA